MTKLSALLVLAVFLTACTQSDKQHAQDQAHQAAEEIKHDSREALHEAEADARKANRELNQGFDKAREKTRHALDQTQQPDNTNR